jgi:hypothetical protein
MSAKRTITTTAEPTQEIPVRVAFNPLAVEQAKVDALAELERLQGATIDNEAELDEFAALLVSTVAERKAIETMREGLRAPLKAAMKAVDALFHTSLQCKEAAERKLRALVGEYQAARAAEQRRLLAEARDAAVKREPERLSAALVASSAAAPLKQQGVGVKEVWSATVRAPDLVPYDWCIPDEKRIAKHARETPIDREPTPIPGVTFAREARTTVRS